MSSLVRGLAVGLTVALVAGCNQGEKMKTGDVESLVQAERNFAATVRSQGVGSGFLSVLDSSAVVFQPGPVNGREVYGGVSASPAVLAWQPVYAEIAASGDLGYTTGPWKYFPDSEATEPVATGQYNSVWRWDSTGVWRLMLDIGISFRFAEVDTVLRTRSLPGTLIGSKVTTDDLLTRDRALAARANTDERATVYAEALAEDARLMRPGMAPLVGFDRIEPWVQSATPIESTFPQEAFLSSDGSLGYVYGRAELTADLADSTGPIAHGGYARIWRRVGDRWKLALDVITVLPGDLQKVSAPGAN